MQLTMRSAQFLLAAVIIARSTALLFSKQGLALFAPLNLLGLRFSLAFMVLAVIFWRQLRHVTVSTLKHGMLLGAVFSAVMITEMGALKITPASTTSFLENTAIVLVPLLTACAARVLPSMKTLICAAITYAGVALLTLREGLTLTPGEGLALLVAFFYAIAIILIGRLAREDDSLLIGILQIGFLGIFNFVGSFLLESPRLPANMSELALIMALALLCTCFGFTFQPVAQRYVPTEPAAQFCALSPLSVAILSVIFLDESLGLRELAAAALIIGGIVLQNSSRFLAKRV